MTTGLLTTTVGRNAIIADLGGGADLVLTHVAWGDANGVPYNPNEAQVALVNEKYRATIASVAVVAGVIVVDAVIPADTNDGTGRPSHGFNVAEVGLFNNAGTLIGLARCGNGYKPPPSSGQAAAVTYRLKLAVANPSAITVAVDPQAQVAVGRLVRPGWLTVDGVLNDPPAAPALGASYIVGPAPTGAWVGFAHRIAQWIGVWSLASVPVGHHAVDNSKGIDSGARWLERTAAGWVSGLSRLIQKQPGNYVVAGGTANAITLSLDPAPADYASLLGTPIRFGPSGRNTGNTTVNINGLGDKQIIRRGGTALQSGDLIAGEIAEIIYDGVAFQLFVVPAGFRNLVVFSANGSFVVPAGVRRLRIRVWGGGGGGGGSIGSASAALAGAGGGYSEGLFDVTPGDVYVVTIGTGGSGGTSGSFGGPGTTTSVGALISATGGGGGTGSNNAGIINGGTTGGQGFGGQINIQAYGGGSGYAVSGAVFSGPGGGSFCVPGAPSSVASPTPPGPALGGFYPAGGGNGGAGTQAGGAGQPGLVLIEY